MNEVFDSALEETAQRILPLAVTDILNRENNSRNRIAPTLKKHDEYLTYLVRDSQGNLLLQSHDADLSAFNASPLEGFSNTSTHRIYGASAVSGTLFIEVAEPLTHRHEAALEAGLALLLPLIEPIAAAVNRLLERLQRALEAERSFTANSAHELRTPLATALAKVQRLKTLLHSDALRDNVTEVEVALRSLSALSEKLLELAKAEGGGAIAQRTHNLVPILALIVADFESQTPGRISLTLPAGEMNSFLDPDAFAILVRNLIENAIKHGSHQHPVEVILSADGNFRVRNSGNIVPADELNLLRNRFTRSKTDASGSGLGLAIADAIATGANIHLHLQSPAKGKQDGFEADLNIADAK